MNKKWTYEKLISLLLIEEELSEQLIFKTFFDEQQDKYKYMIAEGVEDALKHLNNHHFDVIISDISFIDGTAFDILSQSNDTPTIIITAKGDEEIAVKIMQRGAVDYVLRDVERKYLQILPSLILRAAKQKRSNLITDLLSRALQSINVCICVLNTDGLIIFANKSFCDFFQLKSFYYLTDIKEILNQFEISGEPSIDSYLSVEVQEEIRYEITDNKGKREGNIRFVPVSGSANFIIGYVMIGNCHATKQTE